MFCSNIFLTPATQQTRSFRKLSTISVNSAKFTGSSQESVVLHGTYIGSGEHVGGSVLDLTAIRNNTLFHKTATAKIGDQRHGEDLGELEEKHPGQWTILTEKGYKSNATDARHSSK